MSRLSIKNFGPIRDGAKENNGFIDFRKCTVFIGNQGSGKSTVAKLYSTFSWIEKALHRGDLTERYLTSYNRFRKEFCGYQGLFSYFRNDGSTRLIYDGELYNFRYEEDRLEIRHNGGNGRFTQPKIMYVPAERNFLSAVPDPDKVKGLAPTLREFWQELKEAYAAFSEGIELPIAGVRFRYDKLNQIPWVAGDDYELRVSEAASGLQSLIPLFLVSEQLTREMSRRAGDVSASLTSQQVSRLQKEMREILENRDLLPEVRKAALEQLSAKFRNERFINIVEEIEQNLFPSTQRTLLFKMLSYANLIEGNELILTTHSPYIINWLTLAIQGFKILSAVSNPYGNEIEKRLKDIVPVEACISGKDVAIYELADGHVKLLEDYKGIPSDDNFLNDYLGEGNDEFAKLLALKQTA